MIIVVLISTWLLYNDHNECSIQSLIHSISVDSDLYTLRDSPPELRSIHTDSPPELRSIHPERQFIQTQIYTPRETIHLDSDLCTTEKVSPLISRRWMLFSKYCSVFSTQIHVHVIDVNSDTSQITQVSLRSRWRVLFQTAVRGLLDTDLCSRNQHKLRRSIILHGSRMQIHPSLQNVVRSPRQRLPFL